MAQEDTKPKPDPESEDCRMTRYWLTAIAIVLVAFMLIYGSYQTYATKKFVEGGYTSGILPGSNTEHWIKN